MSMSIRQYVNGTHRQQEPDNNLALSCGETPRKNSVRKSTSCSTRASLEQERDQRHFRLPGIAKLRSGRGSRRTDRIHATRGSTVGGSRQLNGWRAKRRAGRAASGGLLGEQDWEAAANRCSHYSNYGGYTFFGGKNPTFEGIRQLYR